MAYRIGFERRANKDLDSLPIRVRARILKALDRLAVDPYGAANVKALRSREAYRLRIGDYRVVYVVRRELLLVLVIEVGHRREVYRGR